jgi:hypothetical protein
MASKLLALLRYRLQSKQAKNMPENCMQCLCQYRRKSKKPARKIHPIYWIEALEDVQKNGCDQKKMQLIGKALQRNGSSSKFLDVFLVVL